MSRLFSLLLSCRQRRMRRRSGVGCATNFVIYHAPRSTPPQKQTRIGTERSFRRTEIREGGISQPIYQDFEQTNRCECLWRSTSSNATRNRMSRVLSSEDIRRQDWMKFASMTWQINSIKSLEVLTAIKFKTNLTLTWVAFPQVRMMNILIFFPNLHSQSSLSRDYIWH